MLSKSNNLFDLKSKKNITETSYPKINITENIYCIIKHSLIILWNIDNSQSIYGNFSFFFLHFTSKSYHFLRFKYLDMCYLLVFIHIWETQIDHWTGSSIFEIPHLKF